MTEHPIRPSQPGPLEERADFRAALARRLAVITGLILLAAILLGTAYVAYAIRHSQMNRAPVIDNTAKAAEAAKAGTSRIEECTTPGRRCYERGQRQLAATVAGLTQGNQRAAAAAAACATQVHPVTYQTVYRCVRLATVPPRKR